MTTNDKVALGTIYENLDFQGSYEPSFNPQAVKLKAEIDEVCHIIESDLKGIIAYYKKAKQAFDQNPNDMNAVEDLKGVKNRIHNTLAQYSQFT
jgi:hypothetical protein